MKILFVATVRSHVGQFHMPFIKCLIEAGHEVHAAFRDNSKDKKGLDLSGISQVHEIPFERNPLKINNIKAYYAMKKLLKEGNYDIVHCHTPVGGVITRLASLEARKNGMKVFYTAHGFHFYKGASKKYWLLYYPIEKYLSRFTDCLILINQEDYDIAIKKSFCANKIVKVSGVGVDLEKFAYDLRYQKAELRRKHGFQDDDFILIYPADLSKRKNQMMLLRVISRLKHTIPQIKLLLPGQPVLLEKYHQYAIENNIASRVEFMGYRRDIYELLALSDVAVSSSRQEGLPINIIEAMSVGKPVVATNVRGNADLIDDEKGGYLVELNDDKRMAEKIITIFQSKSLQEEMGRYNVVHVNEFSVNNVNKELKEIYEWAGCSF